MKVLLLSPHFNVRGGATRLVVSLAKYLSEKGEYVEIWSHQVDMKHTFKEARNLNITDISSRANPSLSTKISWFRDMYLFSANVLRARCYMFPPTEIRKFDVINCHNFPSYLVALSRKVKGKPIIWHCNEPPLELYPQSQQGPKLRIVRLLSVMCPLEKTAVRRLSHITVHGELLRRRVKEIYKREPLVLGPLGVDTKKFKPVFGNHIRAKHDIKDDPCVMTVAAFYKRLDLLLGAFLKVKKKISNAKLLIVGASHGRTSMVCNIIRRLKLEENIRLVPDVSDESLPFFYSACDIFVFPQPNWGFSLVVMEAMACGKAVIVPNTCSASEIIDGRNGVVTDITNPTETASKIIELLANDEKRKEMGDAAREYAEKFLDTRFFLERYYRLLRSRICYKSKRFFK